jgi:hypothetical protein
MGLRDATAPTKAKQSSSRVQLDELFFFLTKFSSPLLALLHQKKEKMAPEAAEKGSLFEK